jgi:hypothetical protein
VSPRAYPAPHTIDSVASTAGAPTRLELLERLALTIERPLSDDGDSFVTLLCRDSSGCRVVLKYVSTTSADAFRRLGNESRVFAALRPAPPLRLLSVRAAARDHLVTAFDPGVLLRPATIGQPRVVSLTVKALIEFQRSAIDCAALGVVDRERTSTYYLKVLTKHIAHLWPALLSTSEATRCVTVVSRAMRAIAGMRVPCHGDFMPTNLLYDAEAGTITFTDLEGFMTGNHPLFDVLALLSTSDRPLDEWHWQQQFLREYVTEAAAIGLDSASGAFREAYRGILTFFLIYRFNEARLLASTTTYFDGGAKAAYLGRKVRDLMFNPSRWRSDTASSGLAVHAANLRIALNRKTFNRHLDTMLARSL